MAYNPDAMIVIAPNGFTSNSIEFAEKSKIDLITSKELVKIADKSKDLIDLK